MEEEREGGREGEEEVGRGTREDGEKRRETRSNTVWDPPRTRSREETGWLLTLEHGGGGVVVEGDVFDHVLLLVQGSQLLSHQNRLPRPGVPHQHHRPPAFQEPVQEVANTDGLCGVDQTRRATKRQTPIINRRSRGISNHNNNNSFHV